MPVKSYAKRLEDHCDLANSSAPARTLDACAVRNVMAEGVAGRS
jgi:hypothetical protein